MFCKKAFIKISQNSQENTSARVYFLHKLQASEFKHVIASNLSKISSVCQFEIWTYAGAYLSLKKLLQFDMFQDTWAIFILDFYRTLLDYSEKKPQKNPDKSPRVIKS